MGATRFSVGPVDTIATHFFSETAFIDTHFIVEDPAICRLPGSSFERSTSELRSLVEKEEPGKLL